MTKEQEKQIEQDIRDEIKWIEDGQEKQLSEASVSTIMAILRVRLNNE